MLWGVCHHGEEPQIIGRLPFSAVSLDKIAHCILVKLLVINIYFDEALVQETSAVGLGKNSSLILILDSELSQC